MKFIRSLFSSLRFGVSKSAPIIRSDSLSPTETTSVNHKKYRVALLFPSTTDKAIPPWGDVALQEFSPTLLITPESYVAINDPEETIADWTRFARERKCTVILGHRTEVVEDDEQSEDEQKEIPEASPQGGQCDDERLNSSCELLLVITPSGQYSRTYKKHSTANLVAWEGQWDENGHTQYKSVLGAAAFDIPRIGLAALTVCHDIYIGALFARYAESKPVLFANSTFGDVKMEKWASLGRLRTLEHRIPLLCTMHLFDSENSEPFGFDANGQEISTRSISPGVLGVEIDSSPAPTLSRTEAIARLPPCDKSIQENSPKPGMIQVQLRAGILESSGQGIPYSGQGRTVQFKDLVILKLEEEELFDYWKIFRLMEQNEDKCIAFQSWWRTLPAPADRLAHVLLGRSLECVSPFILTDDDIIYEVIEVASDTKNLRRKSPMSSTAWIDLRNAKGLSTALRMTGGPRGQTRKSVENEARDYIHKWANSPNRKVTVPPGADHCDMIARDHIEKERELGLTTLDMHDELSSALPYYHRVGAYQHLNVRPYTPENESDIISDYLRLTQSFVDDDGEVNAFGESYIAGDVDCCCGLVLEKDDDEATCPMCSITYEW